MPTSIEGIKYTTDGLYYIGDQPRGAYQDWLFQIWNINERRAGAPARIGTHNHKALRRWFKEGRLPIDVVRRLHGEPFWRFR